MFSVVRHVFLTGLAEPWVARHDENLQRIYFWHTGLHVASYRHPYESFYREVVDTLKNNLFFRDRTRLKAGLEKLLFQDLLRGTATATANLSAAASVGPSVNALTEFIPTLDPDGGALAAGGVAVNYGMWLQKRSKKDAKFVKREVKKLSGHGVKVGRYYYLERLRTEGDEVDLRESLEEGALKDAISSSGSSASASADESSAASASAGEDASVAGGAAAGAVFDESRPGSAASEADMSVAEANRPGSSQLGVRPSTTHQVGSRVRIQDKDGSIGLPETARVRFDNVPDAIAQDLRKRVQMIRDVWCRCLSPVTEPFPLPDSAIESAVAEKVALCVIYSSSFKGGPFDPSKVNAFKDGSKEGEKEGDDEDQNKALKEREDDGLGEDNIIIPRKEDS